MKGRFEKTVEPQRTITRRHLLEMGAAAAASILVPGAAWAGFRVLTGQARSLAFYNLYTSERLKTIYWEKGRYIPEALAKINYLMRDFRANKIKPIDPTLLDLLCALSRKLNTSKPFDLISGYRTPLTNAMLAAHSEGVAPHSMHIQGRAADVRVPGRSLAELHRVALALRAGGVGYYPRSDFVHVDTGRVRHWG
jgi:uncharacterized protein YcbK (DUF882 family)